MDQYDIYRGEIEWQDSHDRRPVLILSPQWYIDSQTNDDLIIAPISRNSIYWISGRHFIIAANDPDFPETHLQKSSYVALDYATHLRRACLFAPIGCLDGNLLRRFKAFWREFNGIA